MIFKVLFIYSLLNSTYKNNELLDSRSFLITHHFVKMNPGTVQAGDKKFKLINLRKQTRA